jgi:hypothetical protein
MLFLVDDDVCEESVVSWLQFSELWFVGVSPAVAAERDWIEGDGWDFGAFRLGIGG